MRDIIFRLGAATLTGFLIGVFFRWRGKPAGMRTFGPVALASAIAVLAVAKDHADAASRVIQGVIVGVGFLGTAVILKRTQDQEARGVPTAATIWLTASLYQIPLIRTRGPIGAVRWT
jgi:putative Mg2+ transporter-C (MgtC) family protein